MNEKRNETGDQVVGRLLGSLVLAEQALSDCYEVNYHPADGESVQDMALAVVRQAIEEAEGAGVKPL